MRDKISNIVDLMEMTDPESEAGYHIERLLDSCSDAEQAQVMLEVLRRLEEGVEGQ